MTKLEYIWIDGTEPSPQLRSKTKVVEHFDGLYNVTDIVIVISFVLGNSIPTDEEFTAADMNEDDIINILDVIEVVNIILGFNDIARSVEWLENNFPELETKKRLERLNIDWRKKND